MDDAAILILAAGASSRMRGTDKLLEDVDGEALLARQVRIASATGRAVHVALPPRPHPRYPLIGAATAIEVADAAAGMGRSIAAGIASLRCAPAVLILLGDMPEIDTGDLLAVLAAPRGPGEVARGATRDGAPGHPILVPPALYPALAALGGDDGGREAAGSVPHVLVALPGTRARLDLDTPEDWRAWRESRRDTPL